MSGRCVPVFSKQCSGHIFDDTSFHRTAASALPVLSSRLRNQLLGQSVDEVRAACSREIKVEVSRLSSGDRTLTPAAAALIEKVCGPLELTSTKWHWSLKNVL